jgi:uroporphyrinogen-III synthase
MTGQGLHGLTVAAFESRMADEMRRLIERYGGRPLVAPSMREIPLQDNREALEFGERLLIGDYDMVILLTGVGVRTLLDVLKTRQPLETLTNALQAGDPWT